MTGKTRKVLPHFATDEEADRFIAEADLAEYDLTGGRPMHFEFERETIQVTMRMPESLVKAIKAKAAERGIPYQQFIREAIEKALG
jgi:predicted DNA binding CopG/RHH family protein